MINVMVNGGTSRVKADGDTRELVIEAITILNSIYNGIYDTQPWTAEEFRAEVGWMITQHEDAVFSRQSQSKRVTVTIPHKEGGAGNA